MKCLSLAFMLVVVFAPLVATAQEKQVTDIKELAGTWRGWVAGTDPSPSTMTIKEDGSYQAATRSGLLSVGQFYIEGGKLQYRSSRSSGTASLVEDKGKTRLIVVPVGTDAMGIALSTGRTEYERIGK